jgi:hypothetical protein
MLAKINYLLNDRTLNSAESHNMRLRYATERDVKNLLLAQSQMMLPKTAQDMRHGGLITKPNRRELLFCIRNGEVLLLEDLRRNIIAGFAIGFADRVMRQNYYLHKSITTGVKWHELDEGKQILESRFSFIHLLGILPDPAYKIYALPLGLAMGKSLFDRHQYILTVLVEKPILNLASRNIVELFGGRKVGDIELKKSMLGSINLALYCIELSEFEERVKRPYLRRASQTLSNISSLF